MFGTEVLRIARAVDGVAVFESFHEPFVPADNWSKIRQQDNSHEQRHGFFVQVLPSPVADKKEFGFGVVDDIMYVVCFEFVKNRNDYSTISHCCQKANRPMGAVTTAYGYFITGLDAGAFQYDMKFSDLAGNIFIL